MNLINHISELLYDHNCVIIPGFGGFITNYKSADFDHQNNVVLPARKVVAFNQSLVENDGLLIRFVANKLNIPYSEAEQKVNEMTQYIWLRLDQYKNFEFRNIGTCYLNQEQKLVFIPYKNHNFLAASYGLPSIKVKALKEDAPEHVASVSASAEVESSRTSNRSLLRYFGTAATVLIFASAVFFGKKFDDPYAYNKVNVTSPKDQIAVDSEVKAGIDPLETLRSEVVQKDAEVAEEKDIPVTATETNEIQSNPVDIAEVETEVEDEVVVSDESVASSSTMVVESEISADKNKAESTNDRKARFAALMQSSSRHHIIVASTLTREEAEKMIKGSMFNDYNPVIIPKPENNRFLISLESFSSEKFANQFLSQIKRYNFKQAYKLEVAD